MTAVSPVCDRRQSDEHLRRLTMEDFQQHARHFNLKNTFLTGATFGIFLTFGNAWSTFLQTLIMSSVPSTNRTGTVLVSLTYAAAASLICLALLIVLVKLDMYVSGMQQRLQTQIHRMPRRIRIRDTRRNARTAVSYDSGGDVVSTSDGQRKRRHRRP